MSADTVVFVADSTTKGLEESKRSFGLLSRYLRERGDTIPVLVQANKQDVDGALSPDEVVAHLKKSEELPVIGASAHAGAGVRETLAHAMRLAIRDVKDRVGREGIGKITGANETADGLFDRLLEIEEQHLLALGAEL